jgi:hypothetical protein
VAELALLGYKRKKPMIKVLSLSVVILVVTGLPAEAQWRGENEKKWGDSIQSDIRNGALPEDICINAKSSATTSSEVAFKDWAYSIARKYCDADRLGKPEPATQVVQESDECGLKIYHMHEIVQGKRVAVKKGDCSMRFNH